MKALYDVKTYVGTHLVEHHVRTDKVMAANDAENEIVETLGIAVEIARTTACHGIYNAMQERGRVFTIASLLDRRIDVVVSRGDD